LAQQGSSLVLTVAGASNIGGERRNEDVYRWDDELGLFAVAEGVTTRPAALVAAETAVHALFAYVTDSNNTSPATARERLERAMGHVNRQVREEATKDANLRGMATAFACAVQHGKLLLVGHVGDSRIMRFRKGQLERLTTDRHTGNEPTRAMGLADRVLADVSVEVLQSGDGVLLTTSGLTRVLDDGTIAAILQRARGPRMAVDELIKAALRRTAPENLTCIYGCWRRIGP